MKYETAGDPMTELKWTRKTTEKIARELKKLAIDVSPKTVGRLLRTLKYSLKVNHKKLASGSSPDRNAQFENIAAHRKRCEDQGIPAISVDTKKKELVGNFKNPGAAWNKEAIAVRDHDFRSEGLGMAAPYGIYDLHANTGSVFVGTSHDTPHFAVASIEKWWRYCGKRRYGNAEELLILADCGGSNGCRCRAWKYQLQQFSNRHGITITVRHYPPGASKWNPIEHRLFSQISKNWAGRPLDSFETVKSYIDTTATKTGLTVKAYIDPKHYAKGTRITDAQMRQINIQNNGPLPKWNYTISPE